MDQRLTPSCHTVAVRFQRDRPAMSDPLVEAHIPTNLVKVGSDGVPRLATYALAEAMLFSQSGTFLLVLMLYYYFYLTNVYNFFFQV